MVKRSTKILAGIFAPFLLALFLFTFPALGADLGTEVIDESIGLSATDPRIIIGRIIQIALGFLSTIALVVILYAGFLWMTSEGEDAKIDKAKQLLKNGVIGLAIILSAWGIATFIISKLSGNETNNGSMTLSNGYRPASFGTSALGSCSIESVYPAPGQNDVPRNTVVMVNFKEDIDLASVCQDESGAACACSATCRRLNTNNFNLSRTDGESNISASVSASPDRRIFVITPDTYLGESTGKTDYSVTLGNGINNSNGESIFASCSSDSMSWSFTVSDKLDLTPPQVLSGGVFPAPDSGRDSLTVQVSAVAASGYFEVSGCPSVYSPAKLVSVNRISGDNDAQVQVDGSYNQTITDFVATVAVDGKTVQLSSAGENLGSAAFDSQKSVSFAGIFSLSVSAYEAGNSWDVKVRPMEAADTISVDNLIYTFADSNAGMNILRPDSCSISGLVANIYAKLSGNPAVYPSVSGNRVVVTAKVAGVTGNNIALSSSDEKVKVIAMSGGQDASSASQVSGIKDKPMNSVIQINFSEAMNPLTLSGDSLEMAPYMKVVNADGGAAGAGVYCSQASDCLSYDCRNSACVGTFVPGKFVLSSSFKTVEFISDQECGLNSCGEKIYCLPKGANLAVQLQAASLLACSSDADCQAFGSYNQCLTNGSRQSCQDGAGHSYPLSSATALSGLMDAALNSLDGNRNGYASGPLTYYYENNQNGVYGDSYRWSFFLTDSAQIDAPQITFIEPESGTQGIMTESSINLNFSALMMNSTLKTGAVETTINGVTAAQKRINIYSSGDSTVGYWISSQNVDSFPLDNEPDITSISIGHSRFLDSVTYRVQAGSGVKDIYQNCFKPSSGLSCTADDENPSCCFGSATNQLDEDGNCQ